MSKYPPGGILGKNDRKTQDNQPDYTGKLEITQEVLDSLNAQAKRGGDHPTMELSGWKKDGRKGPFISLRAAVPYQLRGQGGGRQDDRRDDRRRGGGDLDGDEIPFGPCWQ